jgi:CheY-like chemotaxis protein
MKNDSQHTLFNAIHQISGYAGLLHTHPDNVSEYAHIIEKNAHIIERIVHEIYQTNPNNTSAPLIRYDVDMIVGKKVLIVDDMPENSEILRDIFHTLQCDVECASNGPDALRTADVFLPDIICLDILLPIMDGYAIAEALRKGGSCALLIAISALKEDVTKSVFDGWLSKPFTTEQIISLLSSKILTKKRESATIDLSDLHYDFLSKLTDALDKGALTQMELLINTLEKSSSKQWLSERLSGMDFEAIRNSIVATKSSTSIVN